jgi:hypothetical protein
MKAESTEIVEFDQLDVWIDDRRECGRPMLASLTRGMRRTLDLGDDYLPSGAHLLL